MTELKPCPFCGTKHQNTTFDRNEYGASWEIVCQGCSVTVPCCDSEEEAIGRWNERTSEHATEQPVENTDFDDVVDFSYVPTDDDKWLECTKWEMAEAIYSGYCQSTITPWNEYQHQLELYGYACAALDAFLRQMKKRPPVRESVDRTLRRVVCAAIRKDGYIFASPRHFDIFTHTMLETDRVLFMRDAEQGFIDQWGKFMTRDEAFAVATERGQILQKTGNPDSKELFSEDLY